MATVLFFHQMNVNSFFNQKCTDIYPDGTDERDTK